MCVSVCIFVHVSPMIMEAREALDLLEMEIQVVVGLLPWELGIEHRVLSITSNCP